MSHHCGNAAEERICSRSERAFSDERSKGADVRKKIIVNVDASSVGLEDHAGTAVADLSDLPEKAWEAVETGMEHVLPCLVRVYIYIYTYIYIYNA